MVITKSILIDGYWLLYDRLFEVTDRYGKSFRKGSVMNKLDELIILLRLPVFWLPPQLTHVYYEIDDSCKLDFLRNIYTSRTNKYVRQFDDEKLSEYYDFDFVQQLGSLYIIAPVIPPWADAYYRIIVESYLEGIRSSLPLVE